MKIAPILAELGNDTRLSLFQLLVRAGKEGLTVGEIQSQLQIHASTLAFHIRGLADVGLIEQERSGRSVICRARLDVLNEAISVIQRECCKGAPARGMRRPAARSARKGVARGGSATAE